MNTLAKHLGQGALGTVHQDVVFRVVGMFHDEVETDGIILNHQVFNHIQRDDIVPLGEINDVLQDFLYIFFIQHDVSKMILNYTAKV